MTNLLPFLLASLSLSAPQKDCLPPEELSLIKLNSTRKPSNSPLCGDIHAEFGSCVTPNSISSLFLTQKSLSSKEFTNNLLSLSRSAKDILQKSKEILSKLDGTNSTTVFSFEIQQRLRNAIQSFGNIERFSNKTRAMAEDETCIAVETSLMLSSICLLSSQKVALSKFKANSLEVKPKIAEIALEACNANIDLVCKVSFLLDALSPFTEETIIEENVMKGCDEFYKLKKCRKQKGKCKQQVNNVFEKFFTPNKIRLINGIIEERDTPVEERIYYKIADDGIPIHNYLFEGAEVFRLLLLPLISAIFF